MPYVFTATHGVKLADADRTRRSDGSYDETYAVWAKFTPTASELVNGVTVRRYRFETNDSKVAARLRKIERYGITEVKPDKAEPEKKEPATPSSADPGK
ncbi:hypothetical protein IU433_12250 [Nocardia puris]|uniref:hypothetical protein n=1 Tax=Nocardia puris TaxID=208602 RepID=UPI001893C014|nr:hypothetical protein [Nocardia puris]MBF6459808.1 hypothetical protein [Nocardia puris]